MARKYVDEILFEYTCVCCDNKQLISYNIGTLCNNCYWEYSPEEERNDPDAIGPNGQTLDEYRNSWIRAGKPKATPRRYWREEVN
ncbi:hypothetical protein EBU71_22905 [bacterium]|jgi:hypothetical protein|nr:hypothetical protein [Candidatus Elulimicrobium humile]